MGRFRDGLRVLLRLDEPPPRTALAFALGVWIGFNPFIGLHTWMAVGVGLLFRMNRLALVVGAWLNAWTVAPMLIAGTTLGCVLLGVSTDGLAQIDWSADGISLVETLVYGLRPFVLPYLVGNTLIGIPPAVIAYFALKAVLVRRRAAAA